jgi:hypothetical protein
MIYYNTKVLNENRLTDVSLVTYMVLVDTLTNLLGKAGP